MYTGMNTVYTMLSLPTVPYGASAKAQDDLKVYAPWHTTSPRPCLLLQVSLSQHRMCPTKTTSEPDRECVCFVNIRLFRPRQIPVDIHVPGLILRGRLYPRSFETIYSGIQSQHVQDRHEGGGALCFNVLPPLSDLLRNVFNLNDRIWFDDA